MSQRSKPKWREAVDAIDGFVTPTANNVVRTDIFADVVAAGTRLEARLRRRVERQATRVWHLYQLPSAGDIRRISSQLATLEARLRDMSERFEDLELASKESAQPDARAKRPTPTAKQPAQAKRQTKSSTPN